VFSAKAQMNSASEFLNKPSQADVEPFEAPSVLHFTQWIKGGFQITSLGVDILGGWRLTLNFFSDKISQG
jgi:hypothetical protein